MKARLQIQNFGPIKNIDIEISKFNILIGPHASGKSTISKVLCVIHSFANSSSPVQMPLDLLLNIPSNIDRDDFLEKLKEFIRFKKLLEGYKIENFIKKDTHLFFEDHLFSFQLIGESIEIKYSKKGKTKASRCYYFPAERIALPMINESLFELTYSQSTLPSYFLEFGKDFTVARKNQKLFNIPILKVDFEYKNGKNAVTLGNSESLFLEETSSAIQANLPLLLILGNPDKAVSLCVIEELELHGFPTLQKGLLSYVVKQAKSLELANAYFMLPTHSPYILSVINNLLFAAKVAKQDKGCYTEVNKVISEDSWIEKEEFSAYYLVDGQAKSIVNPKTGLIDENELDGISEDLADEFDALMDLYKPAIA